MGSFTKAQPSNTRLLIGLAGPQGSGKTVSALRLATGLLEGTGKRIALIDTENHRAEQYAREFDFDHCDLKPPFRPFSYGEKIKEASDAGYGAIIIDSMSHEHEGIGGVLDWHEEVLTAMAGNDFNKREALKFTAWIKPKQDRNKLIHLLQRATPHVILCFRAKQKTVMKKVAGKKTEVSKTGLMLVGGDDYGFEMSIIAIMPSGSKGKPDWSEKQSRINDMSGDLQNIFTDFPQISEDVGRALRDHSAGLKVYRLRSSKGTQSFADIDLWRAAAIDMVHAVPLEHLDKFISLNRSAAQDPTISQLIKDKKNAKVSKSPENDA